MADGTLTKRQIAAFALPAIPISALGLPITVYLPPFYAEDMGLSLTVVGTVFMLARFWDVFTDPVLGMLSDRFPTRWGRRRHWIVISAPILMFASVMLFMPVPPVTAAYLLGWMVILYIGWTLLTISHMSWGAELSPDYDERSTIQGWREFALIFGMFTVLAMPAVIEMTMDGATGTARVAAMGWFIVILLPITIAVAVWAVPERQQIDHPHIDWKKAWAVIAANRLLRRILVADLLVGIGPAITGTLYIFLVSYVFDLPQAASLLLLVYFVAGFLGVPAWIALSHRAGKHRTLAYAMIYGAAVLPLLAFIPPGSFWLVFIGNTFYGLAFGAGSFLLRSITADITDYDQLETGQQRTGLYFSLITMTNKVGAALAVGLSFPLLDLIGFTPKPGANSQEVLDLFLYLFVGLPSLFMLAAAAVMWGFPLDRAAQEDLRRRIEQERRAPQDTAGGMANQPLSGAIFDEPGD